MLLLFRKFLKFLLDLERLENVQIYVGRNRYTEAERMITVTFGL